MSGQPAFYQWIVYNLGLPSVVIVWIEQQQSDDQELCGLELI